VPARSWATTARHSKRSAARSSDTFLGYYNLERSHQDYRLKGRTPVQALKEALGRDQIPAIVPNEEATDVARRSG
jgi:hypothetical protein